MRWLIVAVLGIVVFGVVGMTALDKYDERTCREHPQVIQEGASHWEDGSGRRIPQPTIPRVNDKVVTDREPVFETCDGFLPW